jgi:hypothetical protein
MDPFLTGRCCLHCLSPLSASRGNYCNPSCRAQYNRKKRNKVATDNSHRTILSICDYTGFWSAPYREAGYNVIQWDVKLGQDCRLQPTIGSAWGILAAPPCTIFSFAGNRAWAEGKRSEADLLEALSIVDACLRQVAMLNPTWWALENPMGRLSQYIGKPRLIFQPYQYGAAYSKRTCLWGVFTLPKPSPVTPTHSLINKVRNPSTRAVTPPEFARAFFEANP